MKCKRIKSNAVFIESGITIRIKNKIPNKALSLCAFVIIFSFFLSQRGTTKEIETSSMSSSSSSPSSLPSSSSSSESSASPLFSHSDKSLEFSTCQRAVIRYVEKLRTLSFTSKEQGNIKISMSNEARDLIFRVRKSGGSTEDILHVLEKNDRKKYKQFIEEDKHNWELATNDCGEGAEGSSTATTELDIAFETMPISAP